MVSGSRDNLWSALAAFRQLVVDRLQPEVAAGARLDLTLVQSIALHQLATAGPLSISALQGRVHRSQATTSYLVTQLERQGLVERTSDPADGRRTLVRLSRRGQRLLDRLEESRRASFEAVLGDLPLEVRAQLEAALRATLRALHAKGEKR